MMINSLAAVLFAVSSFTELCSNSQNIAKYRLVNGPSIDSEERRKSITIKNGDLAISPDGKRVAYIRRPKPDDAEVWIGSQVPSVPFRKILHGPMTFGGSIVGDKVDLQFSADGKGLMFLVPLSSTYFGLTKYDLTTGKAENLKSRVISYCVLYHGEESGKIVAQLRKSHYFGVWSWFWLLDSRGNEIVPIGDEDTVRYFFFELRLVD